MASKKCPKCGEDNPAEAVMCWACYTPLSGGPAVAGMSAATASLGAKGPVGKGPVGVPNVEEEGQKKGVDPKLIGALVFLLVAGVVGFLVNSSMKGGDTTDITTGIDPSVSSSTSGSSMASAPAGVAPPPMSAGPSNAGQAATQPAIALPYKTVTSPNPKYATGVLGILIAADKEGQAAGFAKYAKNQLMQNGTWKNMQVCVFTDQATADSFKSYQGPRKGLPLARNDYAQLASSGVWNTTPVFLYSQGRTDKILKPKDSPSGWWTQL